MSIINELIISVTETDDNIPLNNKPFLCRYPKFKRIWADEKKRRAIFKLALKFRKECNVNCYVDDGKSPSPYFDTYEKRALLFLAHNDLEVRNQFIDWLKKRQQKNWFEKLL